MTPVPFMPAEEMDLAVQGGAGTTVVMSGGALEASCSATAGCAMVRADGDLPAALATAAASATALLVEAAALTASAPAPAPAPVAVVPAWVSALCHSRRASAPLPVVVVCVTTCTVDASGPCGATALVLGDADRTVYTVPTPQQAGVVQMPFVPEPVWDGVRVLVFVAVARA